MLLLLPLFLLLLLLLILYKVHEPVQLKPPLIDSIHLAHTVILVNHLPIPVPEQVNKEYNWFINTFVKGCSFFQWVC